MRNTLAIGGICLLLIALGAWMYFHAGPDQTPETIQAENTANANATLPKETDITFTSITSGPIASASTERKNYAIYDMADFATFWHKAKGAKSTPPAIDFKMNYVIAVFAGEKPSGGYTIAVQKITDTETARNVSVVITEPGKGCVVSQAKTSPYEFVTVPLDGGVALAHTDTTQVKDCQ